MIPFHKPYRIKESLKYIEDVLTSQQLAGDGKYTSMCEQFIKERINISDILMMTSCTHALELGVRLIDIEPGDEIIIPSFTYPSVANAVLMAGGKVVFSEVTKEHLLLDPNYIEEKITKRTKAIIPVHYGGNCCDMNRIMAIATKYKLYVIEDAAQAFLTTYLGRYAGTIGHLGCYSFHQTKNVTAGEGGALVINDKVFSNRAMNMRQKGTNQRAFKKGLVNRYEWIDIGSSYSPSDLLMAMLFGQLQIANDIKNILVELFNNYVDCFEKAGYNQLEGFSSNADGCQVNGHLFYLIFKNKKVANNYRQFMSKKGISAYTHFVPLHESLMGKQLGESQGDFKFENGIGERLIRLPLYPELNSSEQRYIMEITDRFMTNSLNQ